MSGRTAVPGVAEEQVGRLRGKRPARAGHPVVWPPARRAGHAELGQRRQHVAGVVGIEHVASIVVWPSARAASRSTRLERLFEPGSTTVPSNLPDRRDVEVLHVGIVHATVPGSRRHRQHPARARARDVVDAGTGWHNWRAKGGSAMHVGMATIFQNPGMASSDREVYARRLPAGRAGRAARLRVDLERRAPLHELHDVPGRAAVPHLHGRTHRARRARLDGGRAALARPDARGGADLDARPPLRRAADPRARPRRRQGRVRRLPPVDGRVAPALRRVRRDDAARASRTASGVRRQFVQQPRAAIRPGPSSRSRAAPTPPPSRRSPPIMAQLGVGIPIIPQKPWQRSPGAGRLPARYREANGEEPPPPMSRGWTFCDERRRPRRGAGPPLHRRVLGLGPRPLRVR